MVRKQAKTVAVKKVAKKTAPKKLVAKAGPRKKVSKKAAHAATRGSFTVRMYCQGLGDCFLISFPRESGQEPFRVMIDCGVLQQTPDDAAKLQAVAADLQKETGGKIDLLIVTHEHWDHVAGFSFAQAIFEKFDFKQVWLSWAENPKDPDARRLKAELGKKKDKITAIMQAVAGLHGNGDEGSLALEGDLKSTGQIMNFFGPTLPAAKGQSRKMSLGETMDWLRAKVAANNFCQPGECRHLPGINGVKVYILGPPRDVQSIRKMDPTGDQGYRNLTATASLSGTIDWLVDPKTELPPGPFDDRYAISVDQAKEDAFFREHYGFAGDPLGGELSRWRRIDDDWLGGVGRLALQLDSGVNNTSLAVAFELPDGRTMIFPGDAQIGNWLSWDALKFKDEKGTELTITSKQLLNRAVFYKVGHHGSHNATRKAGGLEEMISGDLVAMIPTDQAFASTRKPPKDGWKMPFAILYEALKESTDSRIARADFNEKETNTSVKKSSTTDEFLKHLHFSDQTLLPTMKDQPLYVEYTLMK